MLRSGKRLLIVSVHRIQLFKLFDEALINQESQDRKKKKPLSCRNLNEEVDISLKGVIHKLIYVPL